jgi:tetratricopeptide (TPR) repeat protein
VADLGTALRIVAGLDAYALWRISAEVGTWAEELAQKEAADGSPFYADVCGMAGQSAWVRGDYEASRRFAEAGQRAAVAESHPGYLLDAATNAALFGGRFDDAVTLAAAAVKEGRKSGEGYDLAYLCLENALVLRACDRLPEAEAAAAEGLALARKTGNPSIIALGLYSMGEVLMEHAAQEALSCFDRCLELARSVGNQLMLGAALLSATCLRGRGTDPGQALPGFRKLLLHWRGAANATQQWITLRNLVELLARLRIGEPASVLYGAIMAAPTPPPSAGLEADRLAATARVLRGSLGETTFDECVRRGRGLGEASVVDLALAAIDAAPGVLAQTP